MPALTGWASWAVYDWLGRRDVRVKVTMIDPDEPPSLTRRADRVHLRLPFDWLVQVALRDATVILGRFVVAAPVITDDHWVLHAVTPDFSPPDAPHRLDRNSRPVGGNPLPGGVGPAAMVMPPFWRRGRVA
jgi:hypothetical protein